MLDRVRDTNDNPEAKMANAVAEVSKVLEDLNASVVDSIDGKAITRGDYAAAFKRVEPAGNWKYPVAAVVEVWNGAELELILRSIEFFTGSKGKAYPIGAGNWDGKTAYKIEAAGYYAAIGA